MKKIIVTLAIAFVTMSAVAGEVKVSARVLDAFEEQFTSATDVTWTEASNYYKVSFLFNGQKVSAFYSLEGELVGTTRNISSLDLPINLQAALKKDYKGYWISDLFEVSNTDGISYYLTVESAESKLVLKSASGDANWKTYRRNTKS